MSKNDGGDPLVLHRTPVPKPVIPRGVMKSVISPVDGPFNVVPGDRVSFDKRLVDGDGRNFAATYHAALAIAVTEGEITFDVSPDVVVTWEVL